MNYDNTPTYPSEGRETYKISNKNKLLKIVFLMIYFVSLPAENKRINLIVPRQKKERGSGKVILCLL